MTALQFGVLTLALIGLFTVVDTAIAMLRKLIKNRRRNSIIAQIAEAFQRGATTTVSEKQADGTWKTILVARPVNGHIEVEKL